MIGEVLELISLHNHTVFCDGKDTMEDFVKTALNDGAAALGFSGHSHLPFDERYCMTHKSETDYNKEFDRLKDLYGSRIKLYRGIEAEFFGDSDLTPYEFVIGSAHFIHKGDAYLEIDESKATVIKNVDKFYGGDYYAYVSDYYKTVAESAKRKEVDIVGHLDLVRKFNGDGKMFDEKSLKYLTPAYEAVEELLPYDRIFEMNSGAVSRGYRTDPYIGADILKFLHDHNVRVTVSADAHQACNYRFMFDGMVEILKTVGYREVWEYDGKDFVLFPLE
ncbi:MAG: PHP domain-containing protein [Lachnospiraceae bacterium]|nr:PHP domain-containing protein [Lachnospiraceae bacterium]